MSKIKVGSKWQSKVFVVTILELYLEEDIVVIKYPNGYTVEVKIQYFIENFKPYKK